MEDHEIVERFLKRDESAIHCTAEKYGTRLLQLSKRITEDEMVSEECVNDTYLEAWNRIPPADPRTYFYAYLARITRNRSINRCISRNRLKRSAEILEMNEEIASCIGREEAEELIDRIAFEKILNQFLEEMPHDRRVIFIRRYFYLDPISSIAEHFGYGESKVKTLLFRMRNDLRTILIKEGYLR